MIGDNKTKDAQSAPRPTRRRKPHAPPTTTEAMAYFKGLGFHPFHHDEESDLISIFCEYADSNTTNYYGGTDKETGIFSPYPFIDHRIEEYARKHDGHVEWLNPCAVAIYL